MTRGKKREPEPPVIEWRDPPPKIVGRKPMDRIDAIEAGRMIRAKIEQDRRRRGIPPEGYLMTGERPDREILGNRGPKPAVKAAAVARERRNHGVTDDC